MPENFDAEEIIKHAKEIVEQGEESQSVVKTCAMMMGVSESALSQKTEVGVCELLRKFLPPPSDQEDHCSVVANRFCRSEANKETLKVLNLAKQRGFLIKGIDSKPEVLDKRNAVKDLLSISLIDMVREKTMTGHIENLRQRGVVYICGALHAARLISKYKDAPYFYPRSTKWQPIEDEENMRCGYTETDFLKDPSQVLSQRDIPSFADRIVAQITRREFPEGNPQSKYLARVFNAEFKVFMGEGFYADALVEKATTPNIADIEAKLKASNIKTGIDSIKGKEYLVIPNINVKDVADRIMSL